MEGHIPFILRSVFRSASDELRDDKSRSIPASLVTSQPSGDAALKRSTPKALPVGEAGLPRRSLALAPPPSADEVAYGARSAQSSSLLAEAATCLRAEVLRQAVTAALPAI